MRRSALVSLAVLALAAPAAARTITHGAIHVGRGAAGAELDMTRAQVVAALGNPLEDNPLGTMSYAPQSSGGIFDVYRYQDTKRVRMIVVAFPHSSGWHLGNGLPVFQAGAGGKLIDHYGTRLKKRYDRNEDFRIYYLKSRLKGRPVETQFQVPRFSRSALVEDVFVLFTDRAA